MLTVNQLLGIMTRSSVPPWRVRDLRTIFKMKPTTPLSLRSVLTGVQGQKVVFFVEVRDASILKSVHMLAELQAIWKKSVPTKTTWDELSQILASSGASVNFLSKTNWQNSAGIAGTVESLVGVPTIRITGDSLAGAQHIAEAGAAASILLFELGAEFGNPYLIAAGTAVGAADIAFLGMLGVLEMISPDPGVSEMTVGQITVGPPEDPTAIQIPEVTIIGQIPPEVNPSDAADAPPIDVSGLPDVPPSCPGVSP